jgi:hypothetical protein
MVFTKIQFIRGIVVSDMTLRVLMGRRFPELWETWRKIQEEAKKNEDFEDDRGDPWFAFVMEEDVQEFLSKKLGLEVETWRCCSELNCKKVVIGITYGEVNI